MTQRPAGRDLDALLANVRAERVKKVAALAGRSARERTGLILVEGPQAVRELVTHRARHVRDLYVRDDVLGQRGAGADIADAALTAGLHVHPVSQAVSSALSVNSQGICAVADADAIAQSGTAGAVNDGRADEAGRIVAMAAILARVRDPGNAGAAIRVADAAGAQVVVFAGDSVDVTNPKVIRASAGSVFHLPVVHVPHVAAAISWAHNRQLAVYAADVHGTAMLGSDSAIAVDTPHAWLFGNEAHGLDATERSAADAIVRIPILGQAESLNLATAVAVCLYYSALNAGQSG